MDYLYYLFVVLAFLAVVLLVEGLYLAWNAYQGPEARLIRRRLMVATGGMVHESSLVKQRVLSKSPGMHGLLQQIPRVQQLDKLIQQSGLDLTVGRFIGLILVAGLAGAIACFLLDFPLFVVALVACVSAFLPLIYVINSRHKRIDTIEQQLPDALDLIGRAMMAGHAFPSALQMVGTEMPEPIATEFRIVFEEINYGISSQEALTNLSSRVPSTDVSYFVIAVLIQRETGGNLAELLENIANLIRDRLKLLGTVRVLSAEGRLSAVVLTLLPFALAFVLQIVNPSFLGVLWTDPMGMKMVGFSLLMMCLGIFAMWRIVKIRV